MHKYKSWHPTWPSSTITEFFSVCPMCNYEAPILFSLVCVPILSCVFICGTGRWLYSGTILWQRGCIIPCHMSMFIACAFDLVLCFTFGFVCVFIWGFVMKLCIMCVCIGQWFKSDTTEGKGVSSNLVVCVSTFLHTRLSLGTIPLPAVWPNLWGMSRVLPSPAMAHYAL